jgi:hypothetical protein
MELREQGPRPTLAQKLGDVTHVSPLLRKVRELSGCIARPKVLKLAGGLVH